MLSSAGESPTFPDIVASWSKDLNNQITGNFCCEELNRCVFITELVGLCQQRVLDNTAGRKCIYLSLILL